MSDEPTRTLAEVESAEADAHFDLLVTQEQLAHAHAALRELLQAYERELAGGYSTPLQQQALRNAKAVLSP